MCRIFSLAALLLMFMALMSYPATAQTPAATADQAQQTPAGKFIQELGDNAIGIVADKSLSPDQRAAKYGDLLRADFDLPAIGHFVLGSAWNAAKPRQRQDYLNLFEALVVRMYGARMNLYSGENFQVKAVRQENAEDTVVTSQVMHPNGGPPTSMEWRVHQVDGQFKVIDVTIEGVSQSVTQRQEYASILENNNNNIDVLLKLMRDRLQNPSSPQAPAGQ